MRYAQRRYGTSRVRLCSGNVRELENVVARGVLRAAASRGAADLVTLTAAHLDVAGGAPVAAEPPPAAPDDTRPFREQVSAFERQLIASAIERSGGNWAAAARSLGMHRSNLHHLATRLGLRES